MFAHLTLPYNWVDCVEPEICKEYVHLEDSAKELNNYPREWVEVLLPSECLDADRTITLYNSEISIHAENGPAVEYRDGTLEWRQNGALHREGGPAVEHPNGKKEWYIHGKLIPSPSHT